MESVGRVTSSTSCDDDLKESESSSALFEPILEMCKKKVPGGDLIASKAKKRAAAGGPSHNATNTGGAKDNESNGGCSQEHGEDDENCDDSPQEDDGTSLAPDIELPKGWIIENKSCTQFEKEDKTWEDSVANKCDLAIVTLPSVEHDQKNIHRTVTHTCRSLHLSGMAHIYCSSSQYHQVEKAAKELGMVCAREACLYLFDPEQVRRRTIAGQPQNIHRTAFVCWRDSKTGKNGKHFYNPIERFGSSMPGWCNVVTGIEVVERVINAEGALTTYVEMPMNFNQSLLKTWCRPGGTVYDPTAGTLDLCMASRELGYTYIGCEENDTLYSYGIARLRSSLLSNPAERLTCSAIPRPANPIPVPNPSRRSCTPRKRQAPREHFSSSSTMRRTFQTPQTEELSRAPLPRDIQGELSGLHGQRSQHSSSPCNQMSRQRQNSKKTINPFEECIPAVSRALLPEFLPEEEERETEIPSYPSHRKELSQGDDTFSSGTQTKTRCDFKKKERDAIDEDATDGSVGGIVPHRS